MKLDNKNLLFAGLGVGFLVLLGFFFIMQKQLNLSDNNTTPVSKILNNPSPTPKKQILQSPPVQKVLATDYHIFQSFNNCGPAALSMALSHYGINKTQEELGQNLRPYQNPEGINDDKSVTLEELAEEAEKYGFIPYHRPNGDIEKIKLFITHDMPVITRTWVTATDDIGHYRVVKGYNEETKQLIQDDSLQDKNLRYAYGDFNIIWQKFNYEYLVLVSEDKKEIAEEILGDESDPDIAWKSAVSNAEKQLQVDPANSTARFNLSVALYNTKDYRKSVEEFEKVESQLPFRTLWYQIEPIQAYYELGNYDRVLAITDQILSNQNAAFSELYLLRGKIYQKQGQNALARAEFEKAVFYNASLEEANNALNSFL